MLQTLTSAMVAFQHPSSQFPDTLRVTPLFADVPRICSLAHERSSCPRLHCVGCTAALLARQLSCSAQRFTHAPCAAPLRRAAAQLGASDLTHCQLS